MAAHAYHPDLPGYDERNVLHDGCEECEQRAAAGVAGLLRLDAVSVHQLWERMLAIKVAGEGHRFGHMSGCDGRLVQVLYEIYVFEERFEVLS